MLHKLQQSPGKQTSDVVSPEPVTRPWISSHQPARQQLFQVFATVNHSYLLLHRHIYDIKLASVGVVPNSLQDIGQASDGAKRRPVAGGLGRSVYTPLLGFRGDLIIL